MDGTDLSITLRNNKAAPSPAQHVDPTESEDAQQKRLLAQLVQAKSDNNSQTETLLHWVDKYEVLPFFCSSLPSHTPYRVFPRKWMKN